MPQIFGMRAYWESRLYAGFHFVEDINCCVFHLTNCVLVTKSGEFLNQKTRKGSELKLEYSPTWWNLDCVKDWIESILYWDYLRQSVQPSPLDESLGVGTCRWNGESRRWVRWYLLRSFSCCYLFAREASFQWGLWLFKWIQSSTISKSLTLQRVLAKHRSGSVNHRLAD